MANTSLSGLSALDINSVTRLSSVSFYLSNNGFSRHIPGDILASLMGAAPQTIVCRTTDQSQVDSKIIWEHNPSDVWSMWDVNTPHQLRMPFNGFVQVQLHFTTYPAATGQAFYMAKNGDRNVRGLAGCRSKHDNSGISGIARDIISAPFSVAVGDYIEFYQEVDLFVNTLVASTGVWASVTPLAVWNV